MAEVIVIVAHPRMQHSRVSRTLMQSAAALSSERIEVRDLYALYPDFLIDVAAEQQVLAHARLVVWLHPLHWYGMTPLLKLWVDEVLSFGWAYGPGGTALTGKDLWLVTSTGGPESSYAPHGANRHFIDAFWPPYEQTAALCGMRFLPPMVLHGAHQATEETLRQHADVFRDRLERYPNWPELADLQPDSCSSVAAGERPDADGVH